MRIKEFFPAQQVADGENLDFGIELPRQLFRFIKTGRGGLFPHGLGGFPKTDKHADYRFFSLQHALEVSDLAHRYLAALHLDDDLFGLAGLVIEEIGSSLFSVDSLSLNTYEVES